MKKINYLLLLLSSLLWFSCATIFQGTKQQVTVKSITPDSKIYVNGNFMGTDFVETKLKRKQGHVVSIQKEGYKSETVNIQPTFQGVWIVPNIFTYGIGCIIDGYTGAWKKFDNPHITVKLDRSLTSMQNIEDVQNTSATAPQNVTKELLKKNYDGYTQITTAKELAAINITEGSYILMNDLTLDNWKPLGNLKNGFSGEFDGNGHTVTIRSFDTSLPDEDVKVVTVGLFGTVGKSGTIKNLKTAGNVSYKSGDKSLYIGGIAGLNGGNITYCASEMNITANGGKNSFGKKILAQGIGIPGLAVVVNLDQVGVFAGGIVGVNVENVRHCYSNGNISVTGNADKCAGGIAGNNGLTCNQSNIAYCFATGSISSKGDGASRYAGGIVGNNYNTIQNCIAMNNKIEIIGKTKAKELLTSGGTDLSIIGSYIGTIGHNYSKTVNSVSTPSSSSTTSYTCNGTIENAFVRQDMNIILEKEEGKNALNKLMMKNIIRNDKAVIYADLQTKDWWESTNKEKKIAFSFSSDGTTPWTWDYTNKRPKLYWEK